MNWIALLLWGLGGCALSAIFLLMQHWSVWRISPEDVKRSKRLVIGGAILRWFLFSLLIIFALKHSFAAMFVVFITFMAARVIFLFSFSQGVLAKPEKSHLS